MDRCLDAFLSEPGTPEIPWRRWKIQFDVYKNRKSANYRLQYGLRNQVEADANQAVRAAAAAAERAFVVAIYSNRHKNEDLFAFLGREGQRQFLAMPDGENFDRPHTDVLTDLDRIFMPPVNRIITRQKFLLSHTRLNCALWLPIADSQETFRITVDLGKISRSLLCSNSIAGIRSCNRNCSPNIPTPN